MVRTVHRVGILALAVVLALPMPALATHMSAYKFLPTEHDDLGRSDEPNFLGGTCVLSGNPCTPLVERVIDTNLDGIAEVFVPGVDPDGAGPRQAVLAPGCWDDQGRQTSGLCGLWTIGAGDPNVSPNSGNVLPPHTVGTVGMSGGVPNRFGDRAVAVRFLDATSQIQINPPAGGSKYIDVNHKLKDNGVSAQLRGINPDLGGEALFPGGTSIWAWYGDWTDKNGNGVVDDLTTCGSNCTDPDTEFTWRGQCIQFNNQPMPVGGQYCIQEPGATLPVWVYPGDHHALCFGLVVGQTCGTVAAYPNSWIDFPGRQIMCFIDIVSDHNTIVVCPGQIREMDDFDQDIGGDPIFGPQNSVRRDGIMDDRSGEPSSTGRQHVYGGGWAAYMYDEGLLTTVMVIAGVTSQASEDPGDANFYHLNQLRFVDVDQYKTWNPTVNNMLLGTLKPTARTGWVLVRDSFEPVQESIDAIENNRLLYDGCDTSYFNTGCVAGSPLPVGVNLESGTVYVNTGHTTDPVHGLDGNPPQSREPNTAADIEPGATFRTAATPPGMTQGDADLIGFRNSYAGYTSWHGWLDVNAAHSTFYNMAWRVGGQCILCTTGGSLGEPNVGTGRPRDPDDNSRVLQPGTHIFGGVVGIWRDRTQFHHEEVFDVLGTLTALEPTIAVYDYPVGPDGWQGDVVNSTAAFRSLGYGQETCTVAGISALREWAQCHPTRDGNTGLPQSFGDDPEFGGEFKGPEPNLGSTAPWIIRITPGSLNPGAGDCWTVPVLVWRQMDTWEVGDLGAIESFQDKCGNAAVITMTMGNGGGLGSRDELILPAGNLGVKVYTSVSGTVVGIPTTEGGVTPPPVSDPVQDVDVYEPFGPAL
jgi:hypothetical protein